MGIKQIETDLFIEFLISLGLVYERHKSSHYTFDNPPGKPQLDRPLIVRIKHKEIPILHIHTNLQTLGISHKEFEDWLKLPKKKRK
ncbi:hypothetical protein [Mucilaginibacter sp.]|uniref:hypothetical protein n=1 Tax=Mucilaginibacter sp. TaxID=1882438 RepID=UPI00284B3B3B|nr:hypothetical protein [Mucilaginibacter sp.]MDR3695211.1 hypothetical protein [Mucilaginibacter sp.]